MAKITFMRDFLILTALFLLFFNGGCKNNDDNQDSAPAPTQIKEGKYTTKAAILTKLQTEYEGIQESDLCIEEVNSLGNFFVVGFFASDKGCGVDQLFFNGFELSKDHSESKIVMDANNFQENSSKAIETYHKDVIHQFKTVLTTASEDFLKGDADFFAPRTSVHEGQVTSEMWILRPSGMIPEASFYLSTLIFDKAGNFVSLTKTKNFSVPY